MDHTSALPTALTEVGSVCGRLLLERQQTVAVGEGSAGGLISSGLLSVPGASGYYRGGAVIYTGAALEGLLTGEVERPHPLRGASEPWALHLARAARVHIDAHWGIGEGGAAGPSGNPYGDPAGHAWVAVAGAREATRHVLTGRDDRADNMVHFAVAALELLAEVLADDH